MLLNKTDLFHKIKCNFGEYFLKFAEFFSNMIIILEIVEYFNGKRNFFFEENPLKW